MAHVRVSSPPSLITGANEEFVHIHERDLSTCLLLSFADAKESLSKVEEMTQGDGKHRFFGVPFSTLVEES